jgi:HELP motif
MYAYTYMCLCTIQITHTARWGGAADRGTDVDLELDWVHGYRSADCRNNACYSASGDVVYHAAAVGIVFRKGTDESVKCKTVESVTLQGPFCNCCGVCLCGHSTRRFGLHQYELW